MARALVLTVIGEDRPGLVEALAELIERFDGSWDESRMARLAGHFAGVVQIHLPDDRAEGLIAALGSLSERGLSASVVDRTSKSIPMSAVVTPRNAVFCSSLLGLLSVSSATGMGTSVTPSGASPVPTLPRL